MCQGVNAMTHPRITLISMYPAPGGEGVLWVDVVTTDPGGEEHVTRWTVDVTMAGVLGWMDGHHVTRPRGE